MSLKIEQHTELALEEELSERIAYIQANPRRFEPYDLDGNGILDDYELDRLKRILTVEITTRKKREATEREKIPKTPQFADQKERYKIIRKLGQGGQAKTYLATDTHTNRQVAIKRLLVSHLENWKSIELFEREGKILQHLHHPGIPSYVDAYHQPGEFKEGEGFYLVQEYVEGFTLEEIIDAGERWDEKEINFFLNHMLNILKYLHSRNPPVIHRDIKPSNIIRKPDGTFVLIDFGAIQSVFRSATKVGSTVVGTSGYMAPEQFMGRSVPATDLYALGTTIVHMLSHQHPADLPLTRMKIEYQNVVNISENFQSILDRLLEPNVEDRFAQARYVQEVLVTLDKTSGQISHKNPQKSRHSVKNSDTQKSLRMVMIILSLLVLMLIGGVVFGFLFFTGTSSPPESSSSQSSPQTLPIAAPIQSPQEKNKTPEPQNKPITSENNILKFQVGELPLVFNFNETPKLKNLTFIPIDYKHQYEDNYRLEVEVINKSNYEIHHTNLRVKTYYTDGSTDAKTEDLIPNYLPPLRPGDHARTGVGFIFKKKALNYVEMEVITSTINQTPDTYPPSVPIEIGWAVPKPDNVNLAFKLRTELKKTYSHKLYIESFNQGKSRISILKLKKILYDDQNKVVKTSDTYVVGGYSQPLEPGQQLTVSLLSTFHGEFHRYELEVTDIKVLTP